MNKRMSLLIASVLAIICFAVASSAQQPAPAPQGAPPAPAPQTTQKPTATPAPPPPSAMAQPFAASPNVRIDVTISDQTGGGPAIKKTMTLVANRIGSVRSGVNVPIPSTTFGAMAPGGVNTVPISSYNYRTMGLSLDVRDVSVSPGGLIRVQLSLEYNPIDEATEKNPASTTPVSFSNFSQSFTLELENGRSLLVAQTSDPVPSRNRTLSVEVKATIVK